MKPTTESIHAGRIDLGDAVPLTTPIYETTTFVFESASEIVAYNEGRSNKYLYSRYGNPTVISVERTLAVLDGAERSLVFASGMAATAATLMAHVRAGDEVICAQTIYGGTLHFLHDLLSGFGVTARFVPLEDLVRLESVLTPQTRIVWFESPSNPTLRCVDIAKVARSCRECGVISVIDNTFASPVNQRPLEMGVDLVMQSATKYLSGHSDVTGGTLSGSRRLIEPVERVRRMLGSVMDPYPAYALGRSLKTVSLRVARHNSNAQAVAEFLGNDSRVSTVHYPGLASHPDHHVAKRQMTGYGGMVCFDLDGSYARAERTFDRFKLITRAASLGGVESLVSMPVLTSQWGHTDQQLAEAGVTRGMLRISVGLEDVEDIIADLDQALSAS